LAKLAIVGVIRCPSQEEWLEIEESGWRKEQEIKMPLDGAGNPEAKECEVSLTAHHFTLAFFLVK
jgi:hypothetical protein